MDDLQRLQIAINELAIQLKEVEQLNMAIQIVDALTKKETLNEQEQEMLNNANNLIGKAEVLVAGKRDDYVDGYKNRLEAQKQEAQQAISRIDSQLGTLEKKGK